MKFLGRLFKNRLFLAFIGIVFLSLFIWYAGPMLGFAGRAPLESQATRLYAIGGLSGLWLLTAVFRFIQSRRKNALLLDSLVEDASPQESASDEEKEILEEKMREAVETLKQTNFSRKGGSRFIYELPWYTIIGPPGAGKTTLLSQSGLNFPLEDSHGRFSIKGVGGTRNCDWWFTDQAVLLDTAGRYTTQDSEAEVDRSAWNNFLALLKEKRSRRPINGVLVALSVQDIIQSDDDTLMQSGRTIRNRIEELYGSLGIAPPVYLIFTKCDLLAGFNEFFDELDRDSREQVWGFTLPIESESAPQQLIADELGALSRTLSRQSIDKLQREMSQRSRELIYSFPMQFAALQPRVREFIGHLTARSRLLETVLFRGVYFTSATQSGSVLDQVIERVSRSYGLEDRIATSQSDSGKSYFINQLLQEVVFPESGLAGTNLKTEKRLSYLQFGAAALLGIVLLGTSALWISSYLKNRDAIDRIGRDALALQRSIIELPGDSLDLNATNRVLNDSRRLQFARGGTLPAEQGLLIERAGLYQGDRVNELAMSKYDELLIDALLPRLLVRLENQMHAKSGNSEFLFEALKTYQMIAIRDRFDSDAVIGWFNFDFDTNLPGNTPNTVRDSLKQHVARVFRERPYRLPRSLDRGLIAQYQQIAANVSTELRAYNRIRNATRGRVDPFFRLTANAGAEVSLVFERSDSISLDQSIPGFFTQEAYRDIFLPASEVVSRTLADDNWVLGAAAFSSEALSPEQLRMAVKRLYYKDYIKTWNSLIGSLKLKSVDNLQNASEFISLITDFDSPLKELLVTIAEQTTLTAPQKEETDPEGDAQKTQRESTLGDLLDTAGSVAGINEETSIDPVSEHFSELHAFVENWQEDGSRLDQLMTQLAEINLQLLPMAQSPAGSIDPRLNTDLAITMQKLTSKAGRLVEPLASLVQGLTNGISDVVGGGFCQQLDSTWKTDVYPYYLRAISNRYPVNRNGTGDIALTDFGAFFGPGGVIDSFVSTYLSTLVSKTPNQWTWIGTGSAVCLTDNTLRQLALAEDISNTFFTQSGQIPSFRFDVVPEQLRMSTAIEHLFLDIGGARLEYFHGPVNGVTSFTWPGNNTQVNLRAEPVVPGTSSSVSLSGPWAVLRLFDLGAREARPGGLTVTFSFSGRPASLTLATSSFNPLNSVALRNFRAPESL